MELSITVGVGGADIDVGLLSRMDAFLYSCSLAGVCFVERGGALLHLDFQMVVRVLASSIITMNKIMKRALGWDQQGIVMCQHLKQKQLHTFHGMVDYCLKDVR